jgi:hypothetical protein
MATARKRSTAAAVVLAMTALVAAACGSSGGGQLSAGGPKNKAAKSVVAAAAATGKIQTATYKIVVADSIRDASGRATMSTVTGAVDRQLQRTQESTDAPDVSVEEVVTDATTVYLKGGALLQGAGVDTPWASVSLTKYQQSPELYSSVSPFSFYDPGHDQLDGLMALAGILTQDVTEVGPATVDGVATTQYHATVSEAAITKMIKERVSTFMTLPDGPWDTEPEPAGVVVIDVWIDGQGLIHRLAATGPGGETDSSSGSDSGGTVTQGTTTVSTGTSTITFDLLTVNQPVTIDVPPASQVTAVDVSKLLGGTFGFGSGSGSATTSTAMGGG